MHLVSVYDKEGTKFEMSHANARDMVQNMGWTYLPQKPQVAPTASVEEVTAVEVAPTESVEENTEDTSIEVDGEVKPTTHPARGRPRKTF